MSSNKIKWGHWRTIKDLGVSLFPYRILKTWSKVGDKIRTNSSNIFFDYIHFYLNSFSIISKFLKFLKSSLFKFSLLNESLILFSNNAFVSWNFPSNICSLKHSFQHAFISMEYINRFWNSSKVRIWSM